MNNNPNQKSIETERRKIIKKEVNRFLNNNFKWFIVLVIIAILVSGFFFLLKPKYKETLKLVKIISEQEGLDLEAKQKELKEIKDFLQTYSEVERKYIEKVNSIVPSRQNEEEFFTDFNHIVSKSGLTLQSIEIAGTGGSGKDGGTGNKLTNVSIQLRVGGIDYQSFKNFLSVLENNLQLIDVDRLTFSPGGGSIDMVISTYYLD